MPPEATPPPEPSPVAAFAAEAAWGILSAKADLPSVGLADYCRHVMRGLAVSDADRLELLRLASSMPASLFHRVVSLLERNCPSPPASSP